MSKKRNRITVSQALFDYSSADKNFLKNVITGDETLVYRYDIKAKAQLSQWVGKSSLHPKKSTSESIKCEGVVISLFPMIRQFYLKVMKRLREAEQRKRTEGAEKQDLDVAPRQCTCSHVVPCP
jgi:hypothetical protein